MVTCIVCACCFRKNKQHGRYTFPCFDFKLFIVYMYGCSVVLKYSMFVPVTLPNVD